MLPQTLLGLAFGAVSVLALPAARRQIPGALESIDSSTTAATADALDAITGSLSDAASEVLDKDVKITASVFENGIAEGITKGLAGAQDSFPGAPRRQVRGISGSDTGPPANSFDPKKGARGVDPRAAPILSGRQDPGTTPPLEAAGKGALDIITDSVSNAASDALGKEVKVTHSVLENGIGEGASQGSQGAVQSLPIPGRQQRDTVPRVDSTV